MKARIVGHVLNYYTGEELPVVEAKVVDIYIDRDVEPAYIRMVVKFATSTLEEMEGTFPIDETLRSGLTVGAKVQVAVAFTQPRVRSMNVTLVPVAMMLGIGPNAIDDEGGSIIYSDEGREVG